MRYAATQKEESRQRIVRSAARELRAKGAEIVRVTDVMTAAGMTNGGFYKHFRGKDQLLEEAVGAALEELAERIEKRTEGVPRDAALQQVIGFYLSEEHLEHPELGCALAALGTEMARMPRPMRQAVGEALDRYAARLSYLLPGASDDERRAAFGVLFPAMAGCVMTARVYPDEERRRAVLAAARAFFLRAFGEGFSLGSPGG